MNNKEVRVAVTGAAGQIGYALLFRIASGQMFGPDTKIHLNLLELEQAMSALKGVVMELDDCAFPLLKSVNISSDMDIVFKDADWALLVGSVPRKQGMERADLIKINGGIFTKQGASIAQNANPSCRVLVVGNPCNTNALIAKASAKGMNARNFFAMTMLDQNRAASLLAKKAKVPVDAVKNLAVWGNHSTTMYPDFTNVKINGKSLNEAIKDSAWLETEFIEKVQKRGSQIIKARGASSAASAANAVVDTVRNLITPTPSGEYFSTAVSSDGSYGIPKGLMFSYPLRSNGTDWEIVQDINLNDFSMEKINASRDELVSEKQSVEDLL